jgi:hypothetical protein
MAKFCKEARWVIVSPEGLYIGQWLSRRNAIAAHVSQVRRLDEPEVSESAWNGLTKDHLKIWARCRRNGDRAVKAIITFPTPPSRASQGAEG